MYTAYTGYMPQFASDCSSCGYLGVWGGCTIHNTQPGGCRDYIARCNCAEIRGDYIRAGKVPDLPKHPSHCTSCGAPADLALDYCPYCNVPYPAAWERSQRIKQLEMQLEGVKAQLAQREQNTLLLQSLTTGKDNYRR